MADVVRGRVEAGDEVSEPIRVGERFLCPSCKCVLVPTPGTMAYRGKEFAGLVCHPCNALWDNPDDSMLEHARSVYSNAEE